jgi:hypothetical protein
MVSWANIVQKAKTNVTQRASPTAAREIFRFMVYPHIEGSKLAFGTGWKTQYRVLFIGFAPLPRRGSRRAPLQFVRACEALECGSLLPLWLKPACWLGIVRSVEFPASKLAGSKAAASCRTPKLRIHAGWEYSAFLAQKHAFT